MCCVCVLFVDKYDADNSGSISADELQNLCYEYGHFITREQTEIAVMTLDASGDKQIGYDEFLQWWKSDDRFGQLLLDDAALQRRQNTAHYFKYHDTDMYVALPTRPAALVVVHFWMCLRTISTFGDTSKKVNIHYY